MKKETTQGDNAVNPVKKVRGVPFVQGDDPRRNIDGRNKGSRHWSTLIGDMVKRKITIKVNGKEVEMTMDEAMVESMLRQAIQKGDVKAFEALTNRHEGKPHQSIDLEVSEPPVPIMPLIKKKKP